MPRVSSHQSLKDGRFDGPVFPLTVPVSYSNAANNTLQLSDLLGGLIIRDCNGAARTDTLPSASVLVEGIQGAMVGTSFEFTVKNISGTAVAVTLAVPAGNATSGSMAVNQSNAKYFLLVFTNVTIGKEAYTLYSLGASAF